MHWQENNENYYCLAVKQEVINLLLCCRLCRGQQIRSERLKQATEFIDMAARHCKNILRTAEKPRKRAGDSAVAPVASRYQRVLRVNAALLVDTVLQQSATRAGVQEAQQLLQVLSQDFNRKSEPLQFTNGRQILGRLLFVEQLSYGPPARDAAAAAWR